MRKIILLVLLLLPLLSVGDNKHRTIKLPVSRWREIKRMKTDSTVLSYTDTLYIQFLRKDSFSYHNRNGFIYNGAYTIDKDSLLDFGTARYKIASKRPTALVLRDDAGIYIMGVDSSDTAKIIVLEKEEKLLPVGSIDQMIGRWTVYKRTTKDQNSGTLDNAVVIRSMYITGPSTDGKLGYIYSGKDLLNDPSWFIKGFSSDQTLSCEGKNLRTMKVVKCQKGELIIEEGDVTYYLKQFK